MTENACESSIANKAWDYFPTGCWAPSYSPPTLRRGEVLSTNPFDDETGTLNVLVNDEEQHSL